MEMGDQLHEQLVCCIHKAIEESILQETNRKTVELTLEVRARSVDPSLRYCVHEDLESSVSRVSIADLRAKLLNEEHTLRVKHFSRPGLVPTRIYY